MHIILAYDVGEDRVGKVCKHMRRYLPRVQNSVFEGEIGEAKFAAMKAGLEKILDLDVDSVLIWILQEIRWTERQTIGLEKLPVSQFI